MKGRDWWEAKIGSGISMDGTLTGFSVETPPPVEYEAPAGLLLLNGHPPPVQHLWEVSRSVDTELEVDSLSNPEDLDEDPVEAHRAVDQERGLNE